MSYPIVDDLRKQGYTEAEYPDDECEYALEISCDYVELICKQPFRPQAGTPVFDGDGSNLLILDVPIVSLTKVEFWDGSAFKDVPLANFAVYNQRKDLTYPRIILRQSANLGFRPCVFPKGPQTVRLTGTFGYTHDGETPPTIKRAMLELATAYLGPLASGESQERARESQIVEEETDDHRVKFAEALAGGHLTGINSVDRVLPRFRKKGSATRT